MGLLKWIEKNPLEAAALGTAAYFTGGAALGAMGGGAAGAAGAGAAGAGTAAGAMGPMMPTMGAPLLDAAGMTIAPSTGAAASGGLLSTLNSVGQAAGAANQVQGLLGGGSSAPMQAPQVPQGNAQGAQTLAQLYQQGMQLSPEDQARMQRKTNWG